MRFTRQLFIAGFAVYAVLCVFAVLFYKERLVLPDDANYLFDLVTNGGSFAIFHHRFIAIFTQLLPYAAIRAGASLDIVAQLYSVNLVLFYAACYALCGFLTKDYRASLALLLSGLLITSHTFYWTASELPQCIALLFTAFAILSAEGSARMTPVYVSVLTGIVITVACSHTLAFFVLSFMIIYLWVSRPERRRWLRYTVAIYVAAMICKSLFLHDRYETHAFGGLRNFARLFPHYFDTDALRRFAELCTGIYGWLPVIFIINIAAYCARRNRIRLGIMVAYTIGYLLLITITFPAAGDNDFYHENLYLPVVVFLTIPFVYDALPLVKRPVLQIGLTAVVATVCLIRIYSTHKFYSARLAWQRGLIRQYNGQKAILAERSVPQDTLLMAWSSPYELWLLSTMEGRRTASVLITPEPDKYLADAGNAPDIFLTTFGAFRYGALSTEYFKFKDTTSVYNVFSPTKAP